ncbi:MAG: glycosyltransferase family 25 protein [Kiritimatiellae bacterium]|nr:glycosyltransferase family 25 protein [Kiritimatiellia bacterium]
MRAFYINLDRRPERRAFMERQFERLGLECERVEGGDGRAMPEAEREKAVSRFRWWCARGYRARDGEIGCALSHQSVYRRMVAEKIPFACILEDDIELSGRFPEMLDAARDFLNAGAAPKVLLIAPYGGRAEPGPADAPFSFSQVRDASAASAYVLNAEAAGRLLEVNTPLHTRQ